MKLGLPLYRGWSTSCSSRQTHSSISTVQQLGKARGKLSQRGTHK
jgi:hypothetical protein